MPIVDADRVLPFPPNPRLRPAKATLSEDTRAGVDRLIAMAPILGATNPDGVPVVEHVMQNLIDAPPPDDDGSQEQEPTYTVIARGGRSHYVEYFRRVQAGYQWAPEDQTPEERQHRCLMEMLFDMHADRLSAAS